ncbi:ribosomal RNA small subunit methyltransferase H [Variibacter gotjawalensis]|uniref:Ribosomal RNA small subunit methyltransferase H n=1 Tax=Variibacter gotjawalensis TaxID=1333996 RepID=A0A0S3PTP2_9BRAD|nr:16S rRNA (cytosine(1402)-N(4))-methyltransferase RsmH [Variibacter gotjawalensis]NIK49622.1 16S rRNA (cytosine1402-N4)-methyltransferase [Variibacter gotjawalensis]RZS45634.1 16S rRNA (cytosine1402-N4)-methyltransferase [Variibacter gotjawalensis]BAT59305.1 ribosomal RNA small subunit methyltransferase H [Variibacter gotjawalensis]
MTRGRGAGSSGADGGLTPHIPVLARQVLHYLNPRDGAIYVDGTFGAGGHTRLILEAANCRVIGIDRDETALALGAALKDEFGDRLSLHRARFSELESVIAEAGVERVDGVLIDLGVSSMQLDQPERGFSFRADGPLDMRMGREGVSAADIVAQASERDLSHIIATLGEERFARPIARNIVKARGEAPIETTRALVDIIGRVLQQRPGEIHPATRTFQALRMLVNEELNEVADALVAAERVLAPGGKLAMISFHSLEDRVVKRFIAARAKAAAVSRHMPLAASAPPSFADATKAIVADDEEIAMNPRSRSAKLRVATRTEAPVSDAPVDAMPRLPSLTEILKGRGA